MALRQKPRLVTRADVRIDGAAAVRRTHSAVRALLGLLTVSAAAVVLTGCKEAAAEGLLAREGLLSVTVLERSGTIFAFTFAANDDRLWSRLEDGGRDGSDFYGTADESYDLFISDGDGKPDPSGEFLSIEGRYDAETIEPSAGFNIVAIFLTLSSGERVYADHVTRSVNGERDAFPQSANYAIDRSLATYTALGRGGRMAITVHFPDTSTFDEKGGMEIAGEVLQPTDDSTFAAGKPVGPETFAPEAVAICDLDGDRIGDIVSLSNSGRRLDIYRGGGRDAIRVDLRDSPSTSLVCVKLGSIGNASPVLWNKTTGALAAVMVEGQNAEVRELPPSPAGDLLQQYRTPSKLADRLIVVRRAERELFLSSASGEGGSWKQVRLPEDINSIAEVMPIDPFGTGWQSIGLWDGDTGKARLVYLEQSLAAPAESDPFAGISPDTRPVARVPSRFGAEQVLYYSRSGRLESGQVSDTRDVRYLAELPGAPDDALMGFFDADEQPDLLTRLRLSRYWMLVRNLDELEESRNVTTIGATVVASSVRAVDFDGDGMDDVAGYDLEDSRWKLFRSELSKPLAGAVVSDTQGQAHIAGPDGRFVFTASNQSPVKLSVQAAGFTTRGVSALGRAAARVVMRREREGICTGYIPDSSGGSVESRWVNIAGSCPNGYAVLAVDDMSRGQTLGSSLPAITCCPLPQKEILTDRQHLAQESCPDRTVFTGYEITGRERRLRCTEIDDRYELLPAQPGQYWGYGFSIRGAEKQLRKSDVSVALRYALGRTRRREWDIDGCVGSPPGSLLVGATGGGCEGLQFRELRLKAVRPDASEAVTVLKKCAAIDSPFSTNPRCRE